MQKGGLKNGAHRSASLRIILVSLWVCCLSLLTACASFESGASTRPITGKTPIQLSGQSASSVLMLPSQQQLIIQGPFIATIHVGQGHAGQVTVRGDSALVDKVGYRYQNQNVALVMNSNYVYPKNSTLWLDIYVSRLYYLQVSQGANVSVGVLNNYIFKALVQDNSQLVLFGTARRMDLTATDFATINAKAIKSRTGFIKASQFAQISVLTNGGLSAWALDQSNIYYYTDPVMVAPYQTLSGSVLRMSGIAS